MANNGCVICRVADTSTDNAVGAALLRRIQEAGYQDEGTGSTFAALERRGLVLCKYEPGSLGGPILFVQITKAGRKLVRDALAIAPAENLPVGTLRISVLEPYGPL